MEFQISDRVRFTADMLTVLKHQVRAWPDAVAYLDRLNADGLRVDGVLSARRINVTFSGRDGAPRYRTVNARDLEKI